MVCNGHRPCWRKWKSFSSKLKENDNGDGDNDNKVFAHFIKCLENSEGEDTELLSKQNKQSAGIWAGKKTFGSRGQ